jgi:hypothetical protein
MAINLDAIRKKMAALGGKKLWEPKVGEYNFRVLPWRDPLPEGTMFPELWNYNLGEGKDWVRITAPYQFGRPDPIRDLANELNRGDTEDQAIAKKLRASCQTYVAFYDRAAPEKLAQCWKLPGGRDGQALHTKFLSFFLDDEVLEDTDDWTDPDKGKDVKVVVTATGRFFNKKEILGFDVSIKKKCSKLSANPDEVKKILDSRPSLTDYYTLESEDEIKKKLDRWINSGSAPSTDTSEGTTRGGKGDALDEIANDVATSKAKKPVEGKVEGKDVPAVDAATKSLDDALKDLETGSEST